LSSPGDYRDLVVKHEPPSAGPRYA
jgi:hypothetical protein